MSVEQFQEALEKLRTMELHRTVRGVDPGQVRKLLDEAAEVLVAAGREQKGLSIELRRLREANHEETVGKALLAATRAGEAALAEARERAASITGEAEVQASQLLAQSKAELEKRQQETAAVRVQFERELAAAKQALEAEHESARVEADAALAEARRELSELEKQAAHLRSLVRDMERRVVEIVEDALVELEALGARAGNTSESNLLDDLQPAAEQKDVGVN